jgi:hypothetical protein
MCYKNPVPEIVFSRWKALNPEYTIEFSLDEDCISFLKSHFNTHVASLFQEIPEGMYKADLWRLCKLYVHGGVYADVDLIPHIDLNSLYADVSFFTCLSIFPNSLFQAFLISKPKSPLLLHFLISFLQNRPDKIGLGPTKDMYECLRYNLNRKSLVAGKKYVIDEITIPIPIGTSDKNIKLINLFYFPNNVKYNIRLIPNRHRDSFDFSIQDNYLVVVRRDANCGWGHPHTVDICIEGSECIYLFQEKLDTNNLADCYVEWAKQKILDSRDKVYIENKGW